MTLTPTYKSWKAMKERCLKESHQWYKYYGGRGIKICPQWLNSFETFLADMGERPGVGWSLERKDNDIGYEPGNCIWVQKKDQSQNQRQTVLVTLNGEEVCLAEACRRLGISKANVYKRLEMGWTMDDALYRPMQKKPRH
jgi:hypothetical protein